MKQRSSNLSLRKMDQFTIAIGDTIFLDTNTDRVEKFNDLTRFGCGRFGFVQIHLEPYPI